jgi:hypothetical protein
MSLLVDEAAKEIASLRWSLPECLHIPVAAVDEDAIRSYVGHVERVLCGGAPKGALLVITPERPKIDSLLPICDHPNVNILHARQQVWVHVGFNRYRTAYRVAFRDGETSGQVLNHAMNRRIAVLKGFQYVRITPVSRGANSSSAFGENWGVQFHSGRFAMQKIRPPYIQYADLANLMVMLDMRMGGPLMDALMAAQKLVQRRTLAVKSGNTRAKS